MKKEKHNVWSEEENKLLFSTVDKYLDKGKSMKYALQKASRLLKRGFPGTNSHYYSLMKEGKKENDEVASVPKPRPWIAKKVLKATKEVHDVVVEGGSFGMGAVCSFGIVTLSKDLLTINFAEDTTLKVVQTKQGMVISKA